MIRLALFLAGLLVVACPCSAGYAAPLFPAFFGTWTVIRLAGAASITESQQSVDAVVGTSVHISAGLITTYDKDYVCKPRDPKVSVVDTEATLIKDFGTRRSDLYILRPSMGRHMPFLEAGCAFALVLERDTLLWPMGNGYIYILKRRHK